MGGSASYRLGKKIANARLNGASQDELDELERQRQAALNAERQKRQEAKQPKEKSFRDKLNDVKTGDELSKLLNEKYSTVASGVVANNDIDMVKRAIRTLDELEEQYPFMKGKISGLEYQYVPNVPAAMHAKFNGENGTVNQNFKFGAGWEIKDNPKFYSGSERGFTPPNQTPESIVAHEFGHAIANIVTSRKLAQARAKGKIDALFYIDDIKKGKELEYLEKRALDLLGIKQAAKARKEISGYAKEARMYEGIPTRESFAEAFADVYSNGDKASNVSKAYVKVLLEEVKNLTGG